MSITAKIGNETQVFSNSEWEHMKETGDASRYQLINDSQGVYQPDPPEPGQQAANDYLSSQNGGANNPQTPGTTNPVSSGIPTDIANNANAALVGGAVRAQGGGNTNQVQGGYQEGAFNTDTGASSTTSGSSTSDTTGASSTTGTQTGSQQGTSTTSANENLGLHDLVSNQAQNAGALDQSRQAYLTDLVDTGGSAYKSQMDQAIRASQSGPAMQNTGTSAKDRAAGYAAAQVQRNNTQERLNAAQQLSGASAAGTLTQQAQPLIGQSTANTGTNTQTNASDTNTSQSSIGTQIQDMVSKQNEKGTATGSSLGIATGETPQQQQQSGGCFVCSVLVHHGLLDRMDVVKAVKYKLSWSKYMPIGYSLYGVPLARLVHKSPLVRRAVKPLAVRILNEELRWAGQNKKFSLLSSLLHLGFHYGSGALGFVASLFGAQFKTRDVVVKEILINNGLYFSK